MQIAGTGFDYLGISSKKLRSHSASSPHLSKAINSDSMVDLAITVCLEDFHDIAAPPKVNTNPLVDFESLISYIQLASFYPSITAGYLLILSSSEHGDDSGGGLQKVAGLFSPVATPV
ncbi:Uncharacterized protein Adt_07819 [Abeliophyllum distichum]|uniref:Uncharacterized protein n=1 Tax=Abeliophyllum distichum TaxID=126358 RepID=A0ABD1VD06_9LAMI